MTESRVGTNVSCCLFVCLFVFHPIPFQAYVSIQRITRFLVLEERDPGNVQKTAPPHGKSRQVEQRA